MDMFYIAVFAGAAVREFLIRAGTVPELDQLLSSADPDVCGAGGVIVKQYIFTGCDIVALGQPLAERALQAAVALERSHFLPVSVERIVNAFEVSADVASDIGNEQDTILFQRQDGQNAVQYS